MAKKILCLDFDGVCHIYTSGWNGATVIPDGATPGLFEFLKSVVEEYDVQIYSSRSSHPGGIEAMRNWFAAQYEHWLMQSDRNNRFNMQLTFPVEKPSAYITIDDRAVTFNGIWPSKEMIDSFKPWNKRVKGYVYFPESYSGTDNPAIYFAGRRMMDEAVKRLDINAYYYWKPHSYYRITAKQADLLCLAGATLIDSKEEYARAINEIEAAEGYWGTDKKSRDTELARAIYKGYCDAIWLRTGIIQPDWDSLKEGEKGVWIATGLVARRAVSDELSANPLSSSESF